MGRYTGVLSSLQPLHGVMEICRRKRAHSYFFIPLATFAYCHTLQSDKRRDVAAAFGIGISPASLPFYRYIVLVFYSIRPLYFENVPLLWQLYGQNCLCQKWNDYR
ncbi:hypothetical protein NPIL_136581 [Nephila pilipes]|uniref:Uncharacterized protein n=1 Tax=Nephila pilipes TaxID=299642 RepID=A0A8X6U581_NEPPI|nr:hypothetical protein NPIL_136581 [Nephila pilipes]